MGHPKNTERQHVRRLCAWAQERRAWPQLKMLLPGMRLRRRFKNVDVVVRVTRFGYVYNAKRYCCLSDVLLDIVPSYVLPQRNGVRRVASHSVRRFFYDAVIRAVGSRVL